MRQLGVPFFVAVSSFLLLADFVHAQVYKGVVLDEVTRKPVPFVTISLQNVDNEHVRHTSTDEDGTFLLVAPEPVDYYLHAKRIGYSENTGGPFWVEIGDTLSVQFRVIETTESLGEVTVEGTLYEETLIENYLKSKNFYTRKKQGIGQFMTSEEIEAKNPNLIADLFRATHGMRAFVTPSGETAISNPRSTCPPNLIIDGLSINFSAPLVLEDFGSSSSAIVVDRYLSLENLVGIEIYPGIAGQPSEFGPKSYCGAIIAWTR